MATSNRRDFLLFTSAIAAATMYRQAARAAEPISGWSSREVVLMPIDSTKTSPTPVATALAIHPQRELLATVGDDHNVRLWQLGTGTLVGNLAGHTDWVRTTRFSPTRPELATAGNDQSIILWDLETQSVKRKIDVGHAIAAIAYSPDGLHLAAVGFAGELLVYSLDSDIEPARLECPCVDMRAVTFSPDGRRLAAGGRSGIVRIWDRPSQAVIDSAPSHRGRVRAVQFTSDGQRLVSCGDDRKVSIRQETVNGWQTTNLPQRPAKFLAFTLTDQFIVVGGTDNKIRLWDLTSYEEKYVLTGHRGSVCTLVATDDGFASGSFDTTIRVWTRTSEVDRRP